MRLLLFATTPFLPVAFAQAGGGSFDPANLLGQIGLGAVFALPWFYLWRDERKQRISAEERERTQLLETVPLLTRSVEVLDAVSHGMAFTVERAQQAIPPRGEMDIALRRVENLADALLEGMGNKGRSGEGGRGATD